MNHSEREQFWQTLCSLPGNDIVAEREQLFKSIKEALNNTNDFRTPEI